MFDSIDSALKDLKEGKLIIVVDDEDRENEGDLVGITEFIDAEAINFMATHARGLICAPVSNSIASQAGLVPMTEHNSDEYQTAFTAFTISIDHVSSTTGISAFERFDTIKALL